MMTRFKRTFVPLILALGRRKERRIFTEAPVIIGGGARSGTTLLLSILSAHPSIFAFSSELSLFRYGKEINGRFMPERIDRLYSGILRRCIGRQVDRWCEKTPNNIRHIQRIDSFFQGKDYRFIHIIRDGRDVILSRHPHTTHRYYHVEPEEWMADVQEGLKHQDRENFLTIHYESLIRDFENTMASVCEHIGIELSDEILNFYEHARVRKSPAYYSGLEKMHSNSIGRWEKPENKGRVDELLAYPGATELLQKLGYL
jgi:hypothetical protein